jgi:hypothetical protein
MARKTNRVVITHENAKEIVKKINIFLKELESVQIGIGYINADHAEYQGEIYFYYDGIETAVAITGEDHDGNLIVEFDTDLGEIMDLRMEWETIKNQ